MSTAISVIPRNDFLAISNSPEAVEALAAIRENMDGEKFQDQDLIRIKNPTGGSLNFEIQTPDGTIGTDRIVGVIVFRCKQGVLWPTEKTGDQKPVLTTNDMKIAVLRSKQEEVPDDIWLGIEDSELTDEEVRQDPRYKGLAAEQLPRLFWWEGPKGIPYTQYGTSTKGEGRGKRAKEYQILYVLRKNDIFPIKLRLGPTSIRSAREYFVKMQDCAYTRAITEISLKAETVKGGGDKYSFAQFKRVGILDAEGHEVIRKQFTEILRAQYEDGNFEVEAE